ncbi:MAG: phytanoyl-CoA dioxygenase family protein [Spirosomaceae bacterium]|jgi:hypothetical protein|nr:phytanoyl-CoA dioxygenase family protein [Spirosomataceae bacterium]
MLSSLQIESFNQFGFLKINNAIPQLFVNKLRAIFDKLTNETSSFEEVCFEEFGNKKYITGIDNICSKLPFSCLEALGLPVVLEIAESICGVNFIPIQDFAVVKYRGSRNVVEWHQDVMSKQSGKAIMMGIYLDDASENEGALKVIPESHKSSKTICELQNEPHISIEMQSGDILIHDLMLAHSSGLLNQNEIRRVLYFEFFSTEQITKERIYSDEFIYSRTRLIPLALKYYREQNPDSELFTWKNDFASEYPLSADVKYEIDLIYSASHKVKPANYCFNF